MLRRTGIGTDGERLETALCYDFKDRLIRRAAPGGAVMYYCYDRNDKISKTVSPYVYEPESDDGTGTTCAYDSRGNRITNLQGETVQELTCNLQNRPAVQKDAFGNSKTPQAVMPRISPIIMMSVGSFWRSGAMAFLLLMSMTKWETEPKRQMSKGRPYISLTRRISLLLKRAMPEESSYI